MAFNKANIQKIVAKIEATEGVDSLPTTVADSMEVFDWTCNPSSDTVTQTPNSAGFVNDKVSYVNKRYDITFSMYLTGAGAANLAAGTPPAYDPIMLACGHLGVGTATTDYQYLPTSTGTSTLTFKYEQNGIIYTILGCKGSIKEDSKIGEVRKVQVTMVGIYTSPVDGNIAGSLDFSAFEPPVLDSEPNSVCFVHGVEVHGRTYSFDQNNTNENYETTKSNTIINSNRQPSASLTGSLETLALFNAYTLWESEGGGIVYWETGTVAGSIVRHTMPNAQIGTPTTTEGGAGITEISMDVIPHPTPSGTDDEYAYILT